MEIIQEGQTDTKQNGTPEYQHEKPRTRPEPTRGGRTASGLILILVGIVLLLANFNLLEGNVAHYLFSWKSLLIMLGVIFIGARRNKTTGYILAGLGILFWMPELFADYNIPFRAVFWPSVLIIIGLALILRHRRGGRYGGTGTHATGYLNDVSVFSGGIKVVKSEAFKGGNLTAIFGGSEFDLREVTMAPEGAVIDIVTIFGGTKIIVPEDWNVVTDAVAILGNVSDKRVRRIEKLEGQEKVLLIKGVIILGGVEIKSF